MEMIKAWVRDLVILVIFASMLEMLLPNGSLKKYVKLVIGFFMMLAILNPILSLFRADYTAFYPFNTLPNGKSQQAMIQQEGAKIQKANEMLAVNTYQSQLEQQIRALILTQGEVEDAQVQVTAGENGTIEAVQIGLELVNSEGKEQTSSNSSTKVDTVRPVKIQIDRRETQSGQRQQTEQASTPSSSSVETSTSQNTPDPEKSAQIRKIQNKVLKLIASFYNLKSDAISFQ